jgi:hypothetical protein
MGAEMARGTPPRHGVHLLRHGAAWSVDPPDCCGTFEPPKALKARNHDGAHYEISKRLNGDVFGVRI